MNDYFQLKYNLSHTVCVDLIQQFSSQSMLPDVASFEEMQSLWSDKLENLENFIQQESQKPLSSKETLATPRTPVGETVAMITSKNIPNTNQKSSISKSMVTPSTSKSLAVNRSHDSSSLNNQQQRRSTSGSKIINDNLPVSGDSKTTVKSSLAYLRKSSIMKESKAVQMDKDFSDDENPPDLYDEEDTDVSSFHTNERQTTPTPSSSHRLSTKHSILKKDQSKSEQRPKKNNEDLVSWNENDEVYPKQQQQEQEQRQSRIRISKKVVETTPPVLPSSSLETQKDLIDLDESTKNTDSIVINAPMELRNNTDRLTVAVDVAVDKLKEEPSKNSDSIRLKYKYPNKDRMTSDISSFVDEERKGAAKVTKSLQTETPISLNEVMSYFFDDYQNDGKKVGQQKNSDSSMLDNEKQSHTERISRCFSNIRQRSLKLDAKKHYFIDISDQRVDQIYESLSMNEVKNIDTNERYTFAARPTIETKNTNGVSLFLQSLNKKSISISERFPYVSSKASVNKICFFRQ